MAVAPVPNSGLSERRRNSCEAALRVEWFFLLQNVEACPRQFVRQRFDRHHVVCLGLLPIIETFRLRAVSQREVGRLDKGPGKIFVAVFGVAFALLFVVAGMHAIHAARVGGKVAGGGKPLDRSGFQQNRGRQNLADARCAGEKTILRPCPYTFLQALLVTAAALNADETGISLH